MARLCGPAFPMVLAVGGRWGGRRGTVLSMRPTSPLPAQLTYPLGIFGAENLVSFVDLFFEAGFMFINKQNSSYFHVSINVEPSRSRPSCTEVHHIYRSCCRCIWRCAAWPAPCLRWNDAPDGLRQGRSPECRSLRNVGTLLSIHLQAKLFSKHQTSTQLMH